MKKIKILFLFVLIIIGTTSFTIYADSCPSVDGSIEYMTEDIFKRDFTTYQESKPTENEFSMKTYFKNLYDYSPINSQGSCGYVSFIQYLSYYDTFFNDNIIPAVYDRGQGNVASISSALAVSPGVLRQSYPAKDLYSFIQQNKDTDFQMKLMDIVNSSLGKEPAAYSCSIGMWDYYRILEKIMPGVGFTYTRVNNFGATAKPIDSNVVDWFDTYTKQQLDNGNPVMLHIKKYEDGKYTSYHSVVAYYYDEKGIHAHFGWGKTSSDIIISKPYLITEAGVLDYNSISNTHSNNYIINNLNYCGCGKHIHQYDKWEYYTTKWHLETCSCGATGRSTRNHAINMSDLGKRYATCIECKALLDMSQDMAIVLGESYVSSKKISANGSYILPSGIIVLVSEDVDAYLNGKLVFFDKNSNLI